MVNSGFEVEVITSNRSCREPEKTFKDKSFHNGVKISRLWRPNFNQSSQGISRLLNSVFLMLNCWRICLNRTPSFFISGTDPIFAFWSSLFWSFKKPRTKLIHWCYDLHPEGAVESGIASESSLKVKLIKMICNYSYSKYDHIVDIGSCMRRRLKKYGSLSNTDFSTIIPWALFEPEEPLEICMHERQKFGNYNLVLMYSGNFGVFHEYKNLISLAEKLQNHSVCFLFSIRGNSASELKESIPSTCHNVHFVEFAPYERLNERLSCADIHIVSLKKNFTGLAIPSKFFGSLAIGRPVLFSGDDKSNIAGWIKENNLGWCLNDKNINEIAEKIIEISKNPKILEQHFIRSHAIYKQKFAKNKMDILWKNLLNKI